MDYYLRYIPHPTLLHLVYQKKISAYTTTAITNSGSTGIYASIDTLHTNYRQFITPINVEISNVSVIMSTHTCEINLPHLPLQAQIAHIFLQFPASTLIYIGLMCNHGYTAHLNDHIIIITHNRYTILLSTHTLALSLWCIDIHGQPSIHPTQQRKYVYITTHSSHLPRYHVPCIPLSPNASHFDTQRWYPQFYPL